MKKQILTIGKTLNKKEQQEIKGGRAFWGCDDFCHYARRDGRAYHTDYQLRNFGQDFSSCSCR